MKYFRFKNSFSSWVLPVYEDSVMARNPYKCFGWTDVIFVGEVTKEDYEKQFEISKN